MGSDLVPAVGDSPDQPRFCSGHGTQDKKSGLDPVFIQQLQNTFSSDTYPPAARRDRLFSIHTADMVPILDIDGKGIAKHSHPAC